MTKKKSKDDIDYIANLSIALNDARRIVESPEYLAQEFLMFDAANMVKFFNELANSVMNDGTWSNKELSFERQMCVVYNEPGLTPEAKRLMQMIGLP